MAERDSGRAGAGTLRFCYLSIHEMLTTVVGQYGLSRAFRGVRDVREALREQHAVAILLADDHTAVTSSETRNEPDLSLIHISEPTRRH